MVCPNCKEFGNVTVRHGEPVCLSCVLDKMEERVKKMENDLGRAIKFLDNNTFMMVDKK